MCGKHVFPTETMCVLANKSHHSIKIAEQHKSVYCCNYVHYATEQSR
jgi:hypothetical protein